MRKFTPVETSVSRSLKQEWAKLPNTKSIRKEMASGNDCANGRGDDVLPSSGEQERPESGAVGVSGWRRGISAATSRRSFEIIYPPPRVTPSQWAEKYAYLPQEQNAEPGKFRLSRRPHQAAMLDDPIDPRVREVIHMGASQAMGKTIVQIILIEYVIHQMRKSIVMVRPTEVAYQDWKRDKFLPTIEATPCMAGLLMDPRKRDARSTSANQRYPGGSIRLIGANSPSGFRSSSAAVVMQDEIDAFEDNKEGDPITLADRAAITFSDAWLIKSSTTTLEGTSRIHVKYSSGDQQKYFVPCCHCGAFHHLLTEQMKFSFTPEEHARFTDGKSFKEIVNKYTWEIGEFSIKDTPRTLYVCESCHRGWTDAQRIDAYLSGHVDNDPVIVDGKELRAEWRATAPFKGIRSRHINGMYIIGGLKKEYASYLHQFAEDFLTAKRGGRAKLQAWTNMFKNEPFAEASEKLDWQPLKDRAEDLGPELPPQAMLVIGTMDVQRQPPRIEILWVAYGEQQEAWLLDWETVPGDLDMPDTQTILGAHVYSKRFRHPYLGEITPFAYGIDYGWQTKVKAVLTFAANHRFQKTFAVKGFPHEGLGALCKYEFDHRERCYKLHFNVDDLKADVFDRLRLSEPGPRYVHIPKEVVTLVGDDGSKRVITTKFTSAFYEELCSERRIAKRNTDGTMTYRWLKISDSARNEPLDLITYNFGIYRFHNLDARIGLEWKKVQQMMRAREEEDAEDLKALPAPTPKQPTPEEMKPREVKLDQPAKNPGGPRPGQRRPMMRRPQKRPPWAGGGFFDPLSLRGR